MYKTEVKMTYKKQLLTTQVSNVIGKIEGSEKKKEYIFITAHYDHLGMPNDTTIYYGADDDGSGTTGLLEIAQAFAERRMDRAIGSALKGVNVSSI